MIIPIKSFLFTSLFFFSSFTWGEEEKSVEVILGIDKVINLNFSPDPRVQVGNESLLTYRLIPQKREIAFKGIKAGRTSVILRNRVGDIKAKYLVTVIATDQSKLIKELKDFIGDVEGIEIGLKGETVYIGGKIVVPSDIGKVVTVLSQNKFKKVLLLVEISSQTQQLIARRMEDEIQAHGLKGVLVRVVNGLFWLEGTVGSQGEKDLAQRIANAFYPHQLPSLAERTDSVKTAVKEPIQNFISINAKKKKIPIPKLIKITAQFVELAKDYKRVFGFKWQPLLTNGQGSIAFGRTQGGEVTTKSSNSLTGTISNLFPKLSSAKSAGYARVIQGGVIVVKNKTTGKLAKTEEIPFALGTGEFARSEKAQAGFTLRVKPELLSEEKIDLNMGLEIKATIGSPPQTLSNSVTSHLVVKSKESAVVGGISINKKNTAFDRDPPGGADQAAEGSSPLFSFVRSKNLTSSKSQFVVFVTPEIVRSASHGIQEIKRKFRYRGN